MESTITGPNARQAREAARVSQSAVAQAIGINRVYFSLYEQGRYLLDATEQKKLREYFDANGISVSNSPAAAPAPLDTEDDEHHADMEDGEASGGTQGAASALGELRTTASATGADSKRTAAAITSARNALTPLDYPELRQVAHDAGTELDDFPAEDEFPGLTRDAKLAWEIRAASVLICAALYGDRWQEQDCKAWSAVTRELASGDLIDRDQCPKRPFLGGAKGDAEYVRRTRTFLAPALVTAGEQRRAPAIAVAPPAKQGWGFFD